MKGETKVVIGVVVIILIAVAAVFLLSSKYQTPPGSGVSPPSPTPPLQQTQVRAFDLSRFTSPTANFIATLANLLIEATR